MTAREMHSVIGAAIRRLGIELPIRFGSLDRLTPISPSFGLARGRPNDRYYIERFLERHRADIKGRVLEAGGYVNYTRWFGRGEVTQADVLYPKEGHSDATLVGDLATGQNIPVGTYDCVILTQVYQFIYDVKSAILHTHRSLNKDGVLLATVSCISPICRYDMEHWGEYWRFTDASVRRLFSEVFGSENVAVETHGNVLAACAFLHGLALEDLKPEELEYNDRDYPLTITVRAVKRERSPAP